MEITENSRICYDCGRKIGKPREAAVTSQRDVVCPICGQVKTVTDNRHFGSPSVATMVYLRDMLESEREQRS